MDLSKKRILVTGGAGFLGRQVVAQLKEKGCSHITIPRSKEHNLLEKNVCAELVKDHDVIIHLAATVGGIGLNKEKPGLLFYENMVMGVQLLEEARKAKVEKFVTVGTICAYPKFTPVPFKEEHLWDGYPEETNAPYGVAKKALLVQSQAYREQYGMNAIFLLPVNMYGPHDNFDLHSSHVIPAIIRKIHEAKKNNTSVTLWGTGKVTREFIYVDDAAQGIVLATENYDKPDPINIGAGFEISIKDLAEKIAKLMNYSGSIEWDSSKPDGQPRRMLDTSKAKAEFGFTSQTTLEEGLKKTIEYYEREAETTEN